MNEKARKRIEEKIALIDYKMKNVYPYPAGKTLALIKKSELKNAEGLLSMAQKHNILQGAKYALEKALEFIDEEESEEQK